MIRFSEEKVLLLHQLMVAETGGSNELRDIGLLDSALEGIFQTFGGEELYPTKEEKGARLGYTLISNHAFVDGNKRTGMLVMLLTLRLNGRTLRYTQAELVDLGLGTADGSLGYEEILAWIISHLDTKNPAG